MAGGKGKSGGKSSGGKVGADSGKKQQSHSSKAGLQVSMRKCVVDSVLGSRPVWHMWKLCDEDEARNDTPHHGASFEATTRWWNEMRHFGLECDAQMDTLDTYEVGMQISIILIS